MSSRKSRYSSVKNRQFSMEPPHHISVILYSNSGAVALKNKSYRIEIDEGRSLTGSTDDDGFLAHENVPSGDFKLILDDGMYETMIPSMPVDVERYPLRMPGYYLLTQSDFAELDGGAELTQDENDLFYRVRIARTGQVSDAEEFSDLEDPEGFESEPED
ncbi:MAG: hypothetical protein JSW33_00165 [bacterium]|nr:MAG: hypothetical protein JSW33_00165 [bacterium]